MHQQPAAVSARVGHRRARFVPGLAAAAAVTLAAALVAAPPAFATSHRRVPTPTQPAAVAHFRVGAAVVGINPRVTTWSGGFGASPPIRPGHVIGNPLSVRALYISNGHRAVELAVDDSQAEFAAYQEGPRFGITAARTAAARAIDRSRVGPRLTAADIIVQSTHSHSAPTLEGLWGPVPRSYLRQVTRAETRALVLAARRARPAVLRFGTANAAALDDVQVAQYDAFPGWAGDPLLTALQARDARTGATIATYTTVPAHPDIVCGACIGAETADYQGIVRAALQHRYGGVALVGPGTLGREETPVQATGITADRVFAREVEGLVETAVDNSRTLRSATIAASERTVTIPGTGAPLLALVEANHLPAEQRQQIFKATGEYPIDRADTAPWQAGSLVGTVVTALRIGNIAYASMPGEPFPEVRLSLAAATSGATVVALSKGQDDLGYFYPAYVAPFTELYPSDTLTNSAAAELGDAVLQAQAANLRADGVRVATALPRPVEADPKQQVEPGLQVVGGPLTARAGRRGHISVRLLATYSPPDIPSGTLNYGLPVGSLPVQYAPTGRVHWDFGDGTHATSGYHEFGGKDVRPYVVAHRFAPGRYRVTATIRDGAGQQVSTSFVVRIHR
jgi:hypothetical protein